jgi:hypothetical protein
MQFAAVLDEQGGRAGSVVVRMAIVSRVLDFGMIFDQ